MLNRYEELPDTYAAINNYIMQTAFQGGRCFENSKNKKIDKY